MDEGGGAHHSVAMSGCYLHLLSSALAGAREGEGREEEEEAEERKTSIPSISELHLRQFRSCFPRVPHFQISYLLPRLLTIALLYFYMSFACSSSNLPPSFSFSFSHPSVVAPLNASAPAQSQNQVFHPPFKKPNVPNV